MTCPQPLVDVQCQSGPVRAIKGDDTLAELAQQFGVHPNQIMQWCSQLLEDLTGMFGGTQPSAPPVDVLTPHAKIVELTLKNDFSKGALTRAGLLSAKP